MDLNKISIKAKQAVCLNVNRRRPEKKNSLASRLLFMKSPSTKNVNPIRMYNSPRERLNLVSAKPPLMDTNKNKAKICSKKKIVHEKRQHLIPNVNRRKDIIIPRLRIKAQSAPDFLEEFREKESFFSDSWREALKELKN